MTYRRLFLWLFAISTVVLVTLCALSRRQVSYLLWAPGGGFSSLMVTFQFSTVHVLQEIPGNGMGQFQVGSEKIREGDPVGMGRKYGILGKFHVTLRHAVSPTRSIRRFLIPLWMPWAVFVGGAFVFCRVMEKRKKERLKIVDRRSKIEDHPRA